MSSDDPKYFRKRATDERKLALASDRQNVAEIHLELARQYDALAKNASLRPQMRSPANAQIRSA